MVYLLCTFRKLSFYFRSYTIIFIFISFPRSKTRKESCNIWTTYLIDLTGILSDLPWYRKIWFTLFSKWSAPSELPEGASILFVRRHFEYYCSRYIRNERTIVNIMVSHRMVQFYWPRLANCIATVRNMYIPCLLAVSFIRIHVRFR